MSPQNKPDHFAIEQRALEYAPKPVIDKYLAAFYGFAGFISALSLFCVLAGISYGAHWASGVFVSTIGGAVGFMIGKSQEDRYWRAYERARLELELNM